MYVSTYICNIVHVGKLLFDFLIDCMFFMLYKFFIFGELYWPRRWPRRLCCSKEREFFS